MIYLRMAGRLHTQIISIGFGLFVKLNRHGRPSEFLSQRDWDIPLLHKYDGKCIL